MLVVWAGLQSRGAFGQGFSYEVLLARLHSHFADPTCPPSGAVGDAAGAAGGLCVAFEDEEGEWIRLANAADLAEAMR